MKVLVTGATGMLGKHVSDEVERRGWDCVRCSHASFDIAFPQADIEIAHIAPDVILNCAGQVPKADYGNHDISMIFSNSIGPRRLARLGIRMIHMSTDCVFDDSLYGRSKRLGESELSNVLNVRGSFVCWDSGLLAWLAKQHGKITGYFNAYWNGTTAVHMANALCDLMQSDRTGTLNVASSRSMNKYTLLRCLVDELRFPVEVEKDYKYTIDRCLKPDIEVPCDESIIKELADQYNVCGKQ